jgi:hypothetical protein
VRDACQRLDLAAAFRPPESYTLSTATTITAELAGVIKVCTLTVNR